MLAAKSSAHQPTELDQLLEAGLAALGKGAPFAVDFDDMAAAAGDRLLISVRPDVLQKQVANKVKIAGGNIAPTDFFIGQGDWHPWLSEIETSRVFREARQLHNNAYRIRPTPAYKHYVKLIETKVPFTLNHVAMDSIETLEEYFKNFRRMFVRAEKHGIVPRASAAIDEDTTAFKENAARPVWAEFSERNIGIAIAADGSLYRLGPGQHRTVVAKLLNLASIPCEVRLVHADWLQGQMRRHNLPPQAALLRGLFEVHDSRQKTGE